MPVPKPKFREIVFEMLYSVDMSQAKEEDMLPLLMQELSVPKDAVLKAQEQVRLIVSNLKEIDALIEEASHSFSFERIQSVERNVIRLALYDLLFNKNVPPKSVIADAIRMARKFGTPESGGYVNAVLDHIYKSKLSTPSEHI